MAAVYHNDSVDIELESGTVFRSFLNHTIGSGDNNANWYGVHVFRNGEPVNLAGCSVQGIFMPSSGSAILISDNTHTWVSENEAAVLLPQACYNVKGQFTLAIKIIGVTAYTTTGTVRIVDGVVADTYSENPVAPTAAVPTYQEILAVYDQMVAVKDGSVRFDIEQSLTDAQKGQARDNIAGASAEEVSDLKSALNYINGVIRSNGLEPFLYKKNTFFNASLVETALSGYDTYKIPVEKVTFIFEKWTGSSSPIGSLGSVGYHYACENSSGVLSRSLSGAEWHNNTTEKTIVFIIPNDCKYLYLTIYTNAIPDLSVFVDYPYPGFEEKDLHQWLPCKITGITAVQSVTYMNASGTNLADLSSGCAYWIPVKTGDKAKITTNVISGMTFVAEYINKSTRAVTRYGASYDTSLEPIFTGDGILVVLDDLNHTGDVSLYPAERFDAFDTLEQDVDTLEQDVDTLEQDVDTLEQDVENLKNSLESISVTHTTGDISSYYARLVSGSTTEIEIKYSTGFSYSRIEVANWMYEVDFSVLSVTGIYPTAIYCGFADTDNLLIEKNPVAVGQYKMIVPDNAKYIYLNFFGSAFCEGYTIKSDPLAKNSQIEHLQSEIDNLDITSPFDGLTGVAFGTSLTYRAQTTGGYLQFLPDLSGITFDNQGVGSSYILGDGGNLDMLAKIKAYAGYTGKRVALLEGFVNDWYGNRTLGTWKDIGETTVCGCVRSALNYMLSQNANLTVFLILDHCGRNYNNTDCSTTATRSAGLTQYEYYSEIEKVANSLGIPVIREFAEGQISENTPQYLMDNIHCNSLGAKQSADFIWSKMKTFLPNEVS